MKKENKDRESEANSEQNKNKPNRQEEMEFLEELRAELLNSSIPIIFTVIKGGIEGEYSEREKYAVFENMPTELLDELDDRLIDFSLECLDLYYGHLAKKKG